MPNKDLLKGQTALVTGASKLGGIGAAIARCYAEHGANLILTARSEDGLKQVAQHCEEAGGGGWVRTIPSDMESPSSIDSLAKSVLEEHGGLDILVANAGTSLGGGDVLKGDPKGWNSTVDINLLGPMRLTRLLAPYMKEKGKGACIFTGSLAGVRPMKSAAAYGASKFAIKAWAEACYEQLRPYGIIVSIPEPGYVNTPMLKDHPADHSLFIQPEDLAEAALLPFLLKSATPLEIVLRLVKPVE